LNKGLYIQGKLEIVLFFRPNLLYITKMQKVRKILIFSLVYYPRFVGGAEIALKEITDRVSEDDIQFDLIALRLDNNLPKYERIGNIAVHRVGFTMRHKESPDSVRFPLMMNKYLYPFLGFLKAVKLHKKNNYDGIWSMMASYNGFAALFFKICFPKIPYLLTLQEGDPIEYTKKRTGFLYPLFRKIFVRADFIQTISSYLADYARDMKYKGPIEVVPNGVDIGHFSQGYSEEDLFRLKEKLGWKEGVKYVITTSRLVVKNAVGDIVSSLKYLPENVELLVLGTGYQFEELRALAEKEKVSVRVHFLGFVPHEEMPKYVQISDVFVRPSLSEGFGNSFIEAMAAGVPVVATPVGGIVDFLKDGETGLFCEVNNPKSIAARVVMLLKDNELKNKITTQARKMVQLQYDWNTITRDMRQKVLNMI